MRKEKRAISMAAVSLALVIVTWSALPVEAADPILWPLQEGQWMEFLVHSPSQADLSRAQIKIVNTTTVGANQYFGVEIPQWGQGAQETIFLRSTEKGLYRLEAEGDCTLAELGQSGTTFRCRTAAGGWEVTTLLAPVALQVPAGAFATALLFRKHIEYDDGLMSPDWDVYIVPGVGPVKQVEYDGNFRDGQSPPGVARSMELVQIGTPPEVSAKGTQSAPAVNPDAKAESLSTETAGNAHRVAVFGTIVEVYASSFTLKQESLKVSPRNNARFPSVKHDLAIGFVDNHLEVMTDSATRIAIGRTSASLSALRPGMRVMVAGMTEGSCLRAVVVSEFTHAGVPAKELPQSATQSEESAAASPSGAPPLQAEISLCRGQDMDYDGNPDVAEFQGCYGGPSTSGNLAVPNIPFSCPLWVGCFILHNIRYTGSLAGWGFDFPQSFTASSSNLTYHVPSSVSMNLQPLGATAGDVTFVGGLGFNFALDIDYDPLIGAPFHFYTVNINEFSVVHQSTGPAPMPGQTLNVEEVSCPGTGIEIPETPIELLTVDWCTDLSLLGAPFRARVTARGNNDLASTYFNFNGSSPTLNLNLTPDSAFVDVTFDDFRYVPTLSLGWYLQFSFLGQIPFYTTPTLNLINILPFMAVTNPFPDPLSLMTVATDPNSPVGDPRYLYQPSEKTIRLPVNPAPTRLTIVPFSVLPKNQALQGVDQGSIQALLQEDYSGAPIVGENVAFSGNGVTINATTDSSGIARATLPLGEYELSASFAGSAYYQPSSANQVTAITPPLVGLKGEGKSFSYKGASGSISFSINSPAAPGALVSVDSFTGSPDWIEVDPSYASQTLTLNPKGKATGSVKYRVLPCEESLRAPRTGSIWVGDHEFVITQGGAPCKLTISPSKSTILPGGGPGEIAVSAPIGCTWTAVTESSWIVFTDGTSGNGNGTVTYSAPMNDTGKNRSGKILISTDWEKPSRKTHTVTQQKSVPLGAPIANMSVDTYSRP